MRFLHALFWFVVVFGVLEIVVEAIERRIERRHREWKYGHPAFFSDLRRAHYREDLH